MNSNETKKPFLRSSRIITASKQSMSGRPALSFCFTWIGYQSSMKSSSPAALPDFFGHRGHGVDAAVDAHVADLGFVGDAAEGDDGPVLEFERRDVAQLFLGPRQVADDEAAPDLARAFRLRAAANVAQALGHDAAGGGRNDRCRSIGGLSSGRRPVPCRTAEGIKDDVVFVAAGSDDSLKQGERLLRWVAERFFRLRVDRVDDRPTRFERNALEFVEVIA